MKLTASDAVNGGLLFLFLSLSEPEPEPEQNQNQNQSLLIQRQTNAAPKETKETTGQSSNSAPWAVYLHGYNYVIHQLINTESRFAADETEANLSAWQEIHPQDGKKNVEIKNKRPARGERGRSLRFGLFFFFFFLQQTAPYRRQVCGSSGESNPGLPELCFWDRCANYFFFIFLPRLNSFSCSFPAEVGGA